MGTTDFFPEGERRGRHLPSVRTKRVVCLTKSIPLLCDLVKLLRNRVVLCSASLTFFPEGDVLRVRASLRLHVRARTVALTFFPEGDVHVRATEGDATHLAPSVTGAHERFIRTSF